MYIVCNHIQGMNVMAADKVRRGWSQVWMWVVGEIGMGLGNVLGNRVVYLFWYPSWDASLKASHWYPSWDTLSI